MKRKPTAEEKVRAFLEFVDGDDRAVGSENDGRVLTDEEVAEQLAAAGFDVEAERAKGRAQQATAVAALAAAEAISTSTSTSTSTPTSTPTPTPNVIPMRRRYARWIVPLAAAAAFAALIGVEGSSIVAWLTDSGEPIGVTHPNDSIDAAIGLRHRAMEAMAANEWGKAEDMLDEAKEIDPPGDRTTAVQDARRMIEQMLQIHGDAASPSPDHGSN